MAAQYIQERIQSLRDEKKTTHKPKNFDQRMEALEKILDVHVRLDKMYASQEKAIFTEHIIEYNLIRHLIDDFEKEFKKIDDGRN